MIFCYLFRTTLVVDAYSLSLWADSRRCSRWHFKILYCDRNKYSTEILRHIQYARWIAGDRWRWTGEWKNERMWELNKQDQHWCDIIYHWQPTPQHSHSDSFCSWKLISNFSFRSRAPSFLCVCPIFISITNVSQNSIHIRFVKWTNSLLYYFVKLINQRQIWRSHFTHSIRIEMFRRRRNEKWFNDCSRLVWHHI